MAFPTHRLRLLAAALGLAALAACGGGGGGGDDTTTVVPAPTNLTVVWDNKTPDQINLYWDASNNYDVDCYALESRIGTPDFVQNGVVPGYFHQATLTANLDMMPELTDCYFRVCALKKNARSDYTNIATARSGLRPPHFTGYQAMGDGIDLVWVNPSQYADTLTLERGVIDQDSGITTWTVIPEVTFGTTHYLDNQVPEDLHLNYRLTYSKGSITASTLGQQFHKDMPPPTNLVATGGVESVHLTWTNHSSSATELVVCRGSGLNPWPSDTEVAHLPPDATSFDDLQLPTGAYTYKVEARKQLTTTLSAASAPAMVITQPLSTGGTLSLSPAVLTMPRASGGALSSRGAWYLTLGCTINTPSNGSWSGHALPNGTYMATPTVLLDSQDHPHSVYIRDTVAGSNERVILHSWFDGNAWQVEEIARRAFETPYSLPVPIAFALDATGSPVILWSAIGGTSSLEYVTKVNGAWKVESLATFVPQGKVPRALGLTLDANGTPCAIIGDPSSQFLMVRQGTGQWTAEYPLQSLSGTFKTALFGPDGDLRVYYTTWVATSSTTQVCERRRSGGTWGAPQTVWTQPSNYGSDDLVLQPATDVRTGRIALVGQGSKFGFGLLTWAQDTWTMTTLGAGNNNTLTMLGFDGDGKLHVVQESYATDYQAPTSFYIGFTEP